MNFLNDFLPLPETSVSSFFCSSGYNTYDDIVFSKNCLSFRCTKHNKLKNKFRFSYSVVEKNDFELLQACASLFGRVLFEKYGADYVTK